MDKVLNFNEFEKLNLLEGKVYQDFDRTWDYKFDNNKWFTKRKTSKGSWKDISGIKAAVNKLNKKYSEAIKELKPVKTIKSQTKIKDKEVDVVEDTLVSKGTNPEYLELIHPGKLNSKDSTKIFKVPTKACAQFVNDFTDNFKAIGDAWIAHNTSALGRMVYDAFDDLDDKNIMLAIAHWKTIHKTGGANKNGRFLKDIKDFVGTLIPLKPNIKLKLDDIVGLYYPNSRMHEIAFYKGGKRYFIEDKNGEMQAGKTIKRGDGWGMNTHLGIVGAIKNGVPIIFHNVYGQVYADPVSEMQGNTRVAWVRRPNRRSGSMHPSNESENFFLNEKLEVNLDINDLDIEDFAKKNISAKYKCIPNEKFRFTIHTLLDEGYDVNFLKAALGIIGRESTYATGKRYDYLGPLKNSFSEIFGTNTSIGPAQMKQDTADGLGVKEDITKIKGATIAAYMYIKKAYDEAVKKGYSETQPSVNFKEGTGSAAFDIAIASYNLGMKKIDKYCETSDPKRKRSCSLAGKTLADGLKVTNKQVKNYLPNYKTERADNVKTSTHGYVKEVAEYINRYTCF